MITLETAKKALDHVIEKGRVHLYKPIQVAEILYRDRVYQDIDLSRLEDYRTQKFTGWRYKCSRQRFRYVFILGACNSNKTA